jgi:DNA-binding NarL/FixJ family response regulator
MTGGPHVMIVDDHAVLAQALAGAFENEGFRATALPAEDINAERIVRRVRDEAPDVVLLDLLLSGGLSGVDLVRPLRAAGPKVLVMTSSQDRVLLARCLEEGADGLFDKSLQLHHLVEYVADAARGQTVLSPGVREELLAELRADRSRRHRVLERFTSLTTREAEVLDHLLNGRSSDEIAVLQSIAVSTVRSHVKSIFSKLGVNSRLAAVTLARQAGWSPAGE